MPGHSRRDRRDPLRQGRPGDGRRLRVKRAINIGLLADDPPVPVDWILIHVGFALSKIDEAEAAAALEFLESIGQAYDDEIAALKASRIE